MAVLANVVQIDPAVWVKELARLLAQVVAPFFGRQEPQLRPRTYLLGLLRSLERNWLLVEFAGYRPPD